MNINTNEELAMAVTVISRVFIQQTLDKIIKENIEVGGIEIVSKEELDRDTDKLRLEDVQEKPVHLEDYKYEV